MMKLLFAMTLILSFLNASGREISTSDRQSISEVVDHFILNKDAKRLDWNWEEAIGLHGLSQLSPLLSPSQQKNIFTYIEKYHNHWDKKNLDISWADECPSALSALHLGPEYYENSETNFSDVIKYLKNASLNDIGAIDHLGDNSFISRIFAPYKNSVWLDSLMMWGNLSLRTGLLFNDQQLIDLALNQPEIFSNYMQDDQTGMFIHSYNYGKDYTYPRQRLFWTRGNGWVVATLADFLELMPKNDHRYAKIKEIFVKLVNGFLKAERKRSLWVNLYPYGKDRRVDTSGSALIAYGLLKGARIGVLSRMHEKAGLEVFKSINKHLKKTKHGKRLTRVIGPTSPGPKLFYLIIPYQRNSYYGHGAYFLMASEILRNGKK